MTMPEARTVKCPNCSAPLTVPMGETEILCDYCDSQVRFVPESGELEVVRTREEMKYRERVAIQQTRMRQQLQQEEGERWRQTAAKVAIAALPIVGRTAGRVVFDSVLRRRPGCPGCGCVVPLVLIGGLLVLIAGSLLR